MSDERYVDAPPAGADAWREVWEKDRRYRPRAGSHEWFLRLARRIARRALEADAERQKNYNLALLDLLADIRASIDALRRDVRSDIDAVQRDVQKADEALAADIARVHDLIPVASKRNDALIAALDQKIEMLAVRWRDLTNPDAGSGRDVRPPLSADFLYRRLEDGLRGSEAQVRDAMAPYLERARAHSPVIDVGCGRGEFLAMCRESGVDARGFDTNERSVSDLKQCGFDVTMAAIPGCFSAIEAGSAGSILATHVVEHLPVEALFALFAEARRVLRAGGLLMIETPNAESILVGASEFWRDPTHLAPRHPAALTLLAREHGFAIDEIAPVHPFTEGTALAIAPEDPPALQRVVRALNERLFGPQDLRLILRKA